MPFDSEDIVKCTLRWSLFNSGLAVNSFVARLSQVVALGATDAQAVTDWAAFLDGFYGNLTDFLHDLSVPTTFELYRMDAGLWVHQTGGETTFTPLSTGEILSHGVAALITARTHLSKIRGRKFIPALVESAVEDGLWGTATLADLVAMGVDYVSDYDSIIDDTVWTPGVWSTSLTQFVPFKPTVLVYNIPSYQRRRKPGVGA